MTTDTPATYFTACDFPSCTPRRHCQHRPRLDIVTELVDCDCDWWWPVPLPDVWCVRCGGTGSVVKDTGYTEEGDQL